MNRSIEYRCATTSPTCGSVEAGRMGIGAVIEKGAYAPVALAHSWVSPNCSLAACGPTRRLSAGNWSAALPFETMR